MYPKLHNKHDLSNGFKIYLDFHYKKTDTLNKCTKCFGFDFIDTQKKIDYLLLSSFKALLRGILFPFLKATIKEPLKPFFFTIT